MTPDPDPSDRGAAAEAEFEWRRAGFGAVLFPIVCPGDPWAVAVTPTAVHLEFVFWSRDIPLADLAAFDIRNGRRWAAATVRHASGEVALSGLAPGEASALADAVRRACAQWWRRALRPEIGALRAVHDRLARLANPERFVTVEFIEALQRDAATAHHALAERWSHWLSGTPEARLSRDVADFLQAPDDARGKANNAFLQRELARSRAFFDTIESHPLTAEQARAVVFDDRRNLVVAAAGSGKTSVIVAKAAWLIEQGIREPSEILVLAFARQARNEMRDRIRRRLGLKRSRQIAVHTFHSLGRAIIAETDDKPPPVAPTGHDDAALRDFLKQNIADLLGHEEFARTLLRWAGVHFAPYRSAHEFSNRGEYWEYLRRHDIRTLKGEQVRSYEKCEIANFLFVNGIDYLYEAPYPHETKRNGHRPYRPDFSLPDQGIYIEHFALNARDMPASFIDAEAYLEEMDSKRRVHARHGTVLIETFSHEHTDGTLLGNLKRELIAHGVVLSPLSPKSVFAVLENQGHLSPFIRLLATFLNHFRSSRLTFAEVAHRAARARGRRRAQAFLALFRPLYGRYRRHLARSGKIDFHDMINRAIDLIESGSHRSPYRYILVDEFQDISRARARLLKALLDKVPDARLFAVGDDWQAIYRFAGSDIGIMQDFEAHFGKFTRTDLATMFRSSDRIASVATRFVLRNPSQLGKSVRPLLKADGPAVHVGLPDPTRDFLLTEALDRIDTDARRHAGRSTVLLLGRYRDLEPNDLQQLGRRFPRLRISYLTIHRSKGLEADYVVVLGMCAGRHGFPSEASNDPLLDLVLPTPETHPDAEERRLLYVAITRARRQVYLLANGGRPSSFVQELIDGDYDVAVFGKAPETTVACRRCGTGRLERRENRRDSSTLYGCTNFPLCTYVLRPCPNCNTGLPVKAGDAHRCNGCGQSLETCPACDNWLVTRIGKSGRFLGCSIWPDCTYTRNLRPSRTR